MATTVEKRKALQKEIRQRKKETLPKLRKALSQAKTERRKRLRQCKKDCEDVLKKNRRAAMQARKKLEAHISRTKKKAKELCSSCKVLDAKGIDQITKAISALEEEKKQIEELKSRAASMISERGRAGGRRAAELAAESDDRVRNNLGENRDLITLFNKMRKKVKATKHMTRTEAFLEFVHNHPEALDEIRAKSEAKWEQEAEKMYKERSESGCPEAYDECRMEVERLKRALKLAQEVPF